MAQRVNEIGTALSYISAIRTRPRLKASGPTGRGVKIISRTWVGQEF